MSVPGLDTLKELEQRAKRGSLDSSRNTESKYKRDITPPSMLQKAQWLDEAFLHCIQEQYKNHPSVVLPEPIEYLQKRYALLRAGLLKYPEEIRTKFGLPCSAYLKMRQKLLKKQYDIQILKVEDEQLHHFANTSLKKAIEAEEIEMNRNDNSIETSNTLSKRKNVEQIRRYFTFHMKRLKMYVLYEFLI